MKPEKKPHPIKRQHFSLPLLFSDEEGERLRLGRAAREMDDKWEIVFDQGWLFFYRSWTGFCIFAVRLEGSPAGVRIVDAWSSRDKEQYNFDDVEADKVMLEKIIRTQLLG